MKKSIIYILFVAVTTLIVSCSEYNRKPGRVYAPDMVYSRAVDYYNGTEKIEDAKGSYNKMPVKGTVAREQALPDHIAELFNIHQQKDIRKNKYIQIYFSIKVDLIIKLTHTINLIP